MILFGTPSAARAADVDDRKFRVNRSGVAGNFPAIYPPAKTDISDQRPVFVRIGLQQGDCFFARWGNGRIKPRIRQSVFDNGLNLAIVINDKDGRHLLVQSCSPRKPEGDKYQSEHTFHRYYWIFPLSPVVALPYFLGG